MIERASILKSAILFFWVVLVSNISFAAEYKGERKKFEGINLNSSAVPANVLGLVSGPTLSNSDFKKLRVSEDYFGGYYRLIIIQEEIYPAISVELIGLGIRDEATPAVLSSYHLPLDKVLGYIVKGRIDFIEWKDQRTFKINVNNLRILAIKIEPRGHFEIVPTF